MRGESFAGEGARALSRCVDLSRPVWAVASTCDSCVLWASCSLIALRRSASALRLRSLLVERGRGAGGLSEGDGDEGVFLSFRRC